MGVDERGERPVTVGVTGHRILRDEAAIAAGVDRALDQVARSFGSGELLIMSSLADGADQLVAERALLRPGVRLIVPLPLPLADYLADFESPDALLALLERADQVVDLPPARTRDEAYLAAGQYIVARSDVLLSVWDGQPARGLGGTGDVVAAARRQGVPLAWVRARRAVPGAKGTREAGEAGCVRFERLPSSACARNSTF
jgi:hypothetical protein